jgi:hypothetical protein
VAKPARHYLTGGLTATGPRALPASCRDYEANDAMRIPLARIRAQIRIRRQVVLAKLL